MLPKRLSAPPAHYLSKSDYSGVEEKDDRACDSCQPKMGAQRTYFHSPDIFRPGTGPGKSGPNAAAGAWGMLQMPRQTPQLTGKRCHSSLFAMLTYERIATTSGNR
jgi:hypothetical protein